MEDKADKETEKEDVRHIYEKKRVIVPAVTAIVILITGIILSVHSAYYKSTDDAFVEGHIITVSPKISGQVEELLIEDNKEVQKGDLLLRIDSRDYEVKLKQARAKLEEANAALSGAENQVVKTYSDLEFATEDFERYSEMYKKGISSKQDYDLSKNNLIKARTNNDSAISKRDEIVSLIKRLEAEVEEDELKLSYTEIYATENGLITHRTVEKGNYVQTGQPLFAIVPREVWVVANFKETQVANMKKGQTVKIKIDAYGHKKFNGEVDGIQMASGAKASLFPPENAVGSYVKIVQRIPVKIVFTDDISEYNIIPGMSVVPVVKVK